jgi:tRNA1(Val) A37 N6-methylase TrmN6
MNSTATLKDWVMFCLGMVKNKGTLSFVFRADRFHDLMALLHRRVGDLVICPLWPREGVVAKRILVQGKKGLHGVTTMTPGIALHGEKERYTSAAEAILRLGQKIDMEGARQGAPLIKIK